MSDRPALHKGLDEVTFRSFYYLKEELAAFCKEQGLSASGGKIELTDRIAHYLSTGEKLPGRTAKKAKASEIDEITLDTLIEPNFVCSEKHRAFFRAQIGKNFSFHVAFQTWLKENTGKSYAQAVEAYTEILKEKKKRTSKIDSQFEYNTYIRDFFADNSGSTLAQAILCWKYKKALPGHNRYERADRIALETSFNA